LPEDSHVIRFQLAVSGLTSLDSTLKIKLKVFLEVLNKLVLFMVRPAYHERNQLLDVRLELVEGLVKRLPSN